MNTCESFAESFSDYVENTVHPEQRQMLDAHLSRCPSCQDTVTRLSHLRTHLRTLPAVKTSPDFETILRTRIMLERRKSHALAFAPQVVRWPRVTVYALAGLIAVLTMGVLVSGRNHSNTITRQMQNEELNISSVDQYFPSSPIQPTKVSYPLDKVSLGYLHKHKQQAAVHERAAGPDSLAEKSTHHLGQQLKTSSF
ncbi:zf-HC2 domain-containing protein [candidate division KSB1 bacterium]|nr:zf-HC2 domain-containing protein [candidate division KSB1 bacterium]